MQLKGYQLQEVIGQGGFGAVYRALQPSIQREVAMKVILPHYANEIDFIRRFESEAQLVARLEHPHIVPLFDYWRDPEGAYLVMRYLRGGNLQQLLGFYKGQIPLEIIARVVEQIAMALDFAHRHGVIHRDLKPDNVLLDEEGNAYLSDFGIATLTSEKTPQGQLSGTLIYMSPEQIKGEQATIQSDIYSFGVMLYQVLTGELPFHGKSVSEVIIHHLNDDMPSLLDKRGDLPPALDTILQQATRKRLESRYLNALEFAEDLRRVFKGEATPLVTVPLMQFANPYKGLRAFEEADAADFFGRAELTTRLIECLKRANFLNVVGPSGSGKSSLIHAGVLPAIRHGRITDSDSWFVKEMTPGDHPISRLASALLSIAHQPPSNLLTRLESDPQALYTLINEMLIDPTSQLVLVIDQFEETFTLIEREAERAHFLNLLANAVNNQRLKLIVTLRADFMDRPLHYQVFGELVRNHTEFVLPMTAFELERAILGPAERIGLPFDRELVQAIISDIQDEPGALPLLQYALTEVFERRDNFTMTLNAYKATGGVLGALGRRADEVYQGLAEPEQKATRQIFLRLITLGEGVEDTRRRVPQSELAALGESSKRVLDAFGRYRLLTFDHDIATREPMVEVAHEALIREWKHVREWLDSSRADIRNQRLLSTAAQEWEKSGQEASYLLSGSRLGQFEEWAFITDLGLTANERAFLEASIAERLRRQAIDAERLERERVLERRARRTMQGVIAVLSLASAFGLIALVVVFQQGQAAERERNRANEARATSEANAAFAATQAAIADQRANELQSLVLVDASMRANEELNTDLALLLAMQAVQVENAPLAAQQWLYDAAYTPGTKALFDLGVPVINLALHPDRRWVAISGGRQSPLSPMQAPALVLWDMETQQVIQRFEGHSDAIANIVFSPDGSRLYSISFDKLVVEWDVATGEILRRFEGHEDVGIGLAITPDGRYLLSGSGNFLTASFGLPVSDSRILVWELETGEVVREFTGHQQGVISIVVSPDGARVVSTSINGEMILWELASGRLINRFKGLEGWIQDADFSPDGRFIAASSGMPVLTEGNPSEEDYYIHVWDAETLEEVLLIENLPDFVISLKFSPDGTRLLSGAGDLNVREWDVASGQQIQELHGHTNFVFDIEYTADGDHALSGAHDGTVRYWNLRNGRELQAFAGYTSPVLVVERAGEHVISGTSDGQLSFWDLATGEKIRDLDSQHRRVIALAVSPDETLLASGGSDRTVKIWDTTTGELLHTIEGFASTVLTADFSPDGGLLIVGTGNLDNDEVTNSFSVWDTRTWEALERFEEVANPVRVVRFSPDGRYVGIALSIRFLDLGGSRAEIWRIEGAEQVWSFESEVPGNMVVAFSPDSTLFAMSEESGLIRVFNVESGREVWRLSGHTDFITQLEFTENMLVSSSTDSTLRTWDMRSGFEVRRTMLGGPVINYFVLDGDELLFGANDGTVKLWQLQTYDELQGWIADNRYMREFTCEERVQYRIAPLCE